MSKNLEEDHYLELEDEIIKWHVTDREIDYTQYIELDGGRIKLPKNASKGVIEDLLEQDIRS